MKKKGGKLRCPDCNQAQLYYRRRTDDYACIKCPKISKKEELKNED